MQVKISQAVRMVIAAIKAGTVPMIHGSPGIGKSELCHQVAKEYNLYLIDLRLSQCDPTDLAGFPQIDQARQKAGYLPMDTFPLEGEEPPAGYSGWMLFFDEANSAPKAVQAAAYKIILDRKVGQKKLHKHCALVAAGNLATDGAIVEEMSTALQSRLAPHMELVVDQKEWLDWAYAKKFNYRITDFIKAFPGHLYTFKADHTDFTYGCPRTWEFANRHVSVTDEDDPDLLPILAGTISEGLSREFVTFCKVYAKLPKIEQIEANPNTVKVPTETSIIWALTGTIAHSINEDNAAALVQYIHRLPDEFQVVSLREIIRKHKPLLKHPAVASWVAKSAEAFF